MILKPLAAAALAAVVTLAQGQTLATDPWVRGTVPHQRASGFFVTLKSAQGGTLVAVSTPVAGVVEIHEMSMDGSVMRMRALPGGLPLPAGQAVTLAPGGYHVMLMDLKQPLNAGDTVPVTLTIEGADGQRETLQLQAPVRALGAMPMPGMKH
jgi:copper(I)-binding protein